MTTKIMTAYVHSFIDGVRVTAKPGDPAPDWVKNPNAVTDAEPAEAHAETGTSDEGESDETNEDEDSEAQADKSEEKPKRRGRPRKKAEPTLKERAEALGIEIDPDWSDAEIEAQVASKE